MILAFIIPLWFNRCFNHGKIKVYAEKKYIGYMWNACEEWNSAEKVFYPTCDKSKADVTIESGYNKKTAYAITYQDGRILINEKLWQKADTDIKRQIITHELGHTLGLHHAEGKGADNSVMYKVVFGRKITKKDKKIFKKYYRQRFKK